MQESKLMTRRTWIALPLVLAACRSRAPLPALLPATVAGVWRRTSLRDPSVSEAPDPLPRTAVERFQVAAYEGPGKLEARLYELTSPAVGAGLAERWRPSSDTVFFARGPYFVVIRWEEADRKALQSFVRELGLALPAGDAAPR